jgi:HEAT repeat protein
MKPTFAFAIVAMLATGCSQAPPLSGGKPIDHWIKAVQDPDAKQRKTAVCKLGNAGAEPAEAWTALCGALRDRDAEVRREAIVALMKCGPRAEETVPTLVELQRSDPDARVRAFASKAVKKLQTPSAL